MGMQFLNFYAKNNPRLVDVIKINSYFKIKRLTVFDDI